MKIPFAIRLFLFLLTTLFTGNVFGQLLPDPGGDPLQAVDSVAQTSNMKSLHSNLKESGNDFLSKSPFLQLGKTLPYATADNNEKKQEQPFLKNIHAANFSWWAPIFTN